MECNGCGLRFDIIVGKGDFNGREYSKYCPKCRTPIDWRGRK